MTERERLIELIRFAYGKGRTNEDVKQVEETIADYLIKNGVIVPPEYAKIVRCSECENLKIIGTKEKYAHCEKYGFDFLPFKADTRGHFCVQYE